jgi:benzodiazapine receptor
MKNWNSLIVFLLFVTGCFVVAGFGAFFTSGSVNEWYPMIRKPSWTPPSWLFGPVWTFLYLIMGIAGWMIWYKAGWDRASGALGLFAFQLVLNAAWSPLFFGLKNPLAGLLAIVPLWAAIFVTLLSFWKISQFAGLLMVPYWLWVSFATVLNFAIWRMNR